jgi:hypothetical protein
MFDFLRKFFVREVVITKLVEVPESETTGFNFEVYKDKRGKFRWRVKAANNKIVAVGGESFKNKADVVSIGEKIFKKGIIPN